MRDQPISGQDIDNLTELAKSHVIAEFEIKGFRYLIIAYDTCLEINGYLPIAQQSPTDLEHLDPDHYSPPLEVGRFEINGQLCAIVEAASSAITSPPKLPTNLTERELQIAYCVAQGKPNKQIATQLHISEWTVATHLRRIFSKLGVDSRAAMVYQCASILQDRSSLPS